MAEEVIDLSQLIKGDPRNIIAYADATAKLETVLESLADVVKTNKAEFDTLKATLGSSNQVTKKQIDLLNKVIKQYEELINKSKANTQTTSALEKAKQRLNHLYTEEGKLLVETQQKITARRKEVKEAIQAEDLHSSSLVRMRQRLNEARREFDKLSESERNAKNQGGLLRKEIQSLDTNIRKLEASTGRMQRNVGNYTRSIKDAVGAQTGFNLSLSKTQIVMGLVAAVIAQLIRNFSSFENQNAKLKGVLQGTNQEMEALNKNALDLGKNTAFTATEVAQLQTELAKLGFSANEIVLATEGILNLSIAAGTDLANAAEIAGTTLRSLGLATSQTDKLVNIMTNSFVSSALDITKWKESIKFVGPVAREAGVSVEELASLMSVLADAGISGSNAGTALRRILSELGKTGKPVGEALQDLTEKGLSLADAQDEVGRTAQTALIVLGNNIEKIDKLTGKYEESGEIAKKLADEQLQTLTGQVKLLTSAWDGLLLSVDKGDGVFSKISKGVVSASKGLLDNLSRINFQQSLFTTGLAKASLEARQTFLEIGELGSASVAEIIEKTFGEKVDHRAFLANIQESREAFTKAFREQGATLKVTEALWEAYRAKVLEGFYSIQEAEQDALDYERELKEKQLAQLEAEKRKESQKRAKELAEEEAKLKLKVETLSREIAEIANETIRVTFDATFIDEFQQRLDEFGKAERTVQDGDGYCQLLGIDKTKTEEEEEQIRENQKALKDGEKITDAYRESTKKSNEELIKMGIGAITSAKDFEEGVKNIGRSAKDLIKAKFAEAIANTIAGASKKPPPAGLILGGIAAAGFVALFDKFIPKFRKGTKNSPKGPAIVNEEGREAYLTKKGEFGLLGSGKGGPELVNLEGGTKIFTAKETSNLLTEIMASQERKAFAVNVNKGLKAVKSRDKQVIEVKNNFSKEDISRAIREGIALGMSKQTIEKTIVSERGIRTMTERGNKRVIQQKKDNKF